MKWSITPSDADQPRNTTKDPLHVPNGPMTRSKTKALKEVMNALVLKELKDKVRIAWTIGISRGDPSTSYPCGGGVQYNLIWAMN